MIIDLRSDTVTKPTKEMLEAMMQTRVGDDVFDEDPTVNALEEKAATMFGHEDALFCPSGTMTNQVAIRISTQPQQEIICHKLSHVYMYEAGGIAFNSGCTACLLDGEHGILSEKDVEENINPDDTHRPQTALVAIENTHNRGGGSYYTLEKIKRIAEVCKKNKLKFHLDGARIFNALTETKEAPAEIGKYFDTISVCLSKGLGAPVGSLLISSNENIKKARRVRKVFGGGMRQAGYLAAAGIYALDHHLLRLKDDHRRAKILGDAFAKLPAVEEVFPVRTNIVVLKLKPEITVPDFLNKLSQQNIRGVPFGKQTVRFVTHLDFTDEMLEKTVEVIKKGVG